MTDKVTKKRRLVQVAWELSRKATEDRELSALKDARAEINVADCTVVTWDSEGEQDGVRIVPIWKWCLEEAALNGDEDQ